MDDFRVGSVPSSDPYGHRQPSGSVARKREKHRDDQSGEQQDDAADIFEPIHSLDNQASEDQEEAAGEPIEDYYLPSDPSGDTE
jgi:hypothetical protein